MHPVDPLKKNEPQALPDRPNRGNFLGRNIIPIFSTVITQPFKLTKSLIEYYQKKNSEIAAHKDDSPEKINQADNIALKGSPYEKVGSEMVDKLLSLAESIDANYKDQFCKNLGWFLGSRSNDNKKYQGLIIEGKKYQKNLKEGEQVTLQELSNWMGGLITLIDHGFRHSATLPREFRDTLDRASELYLALTESKALIAEGDKPIEKKSPFYGLYRKKIRDLNKEETSSPVFGKIKRIATQLPDLIRTRSIQNYSDEFRYGVFLSAEHMSTEDLGGGRPFEAMKQVIRILDSMDSSTFKELRNKIYSASLMAHSLMETDSSMFIEEDEKCNEKTLRDLLHNLNVDESFAFSSNVPDHAMLMVVTCIGKDKQGNKKYKLVQHNEGDGILRYHYSKVDQNGKQMYQTALEITNIPAKNLTGKESTFLQELIKIQSCDSSEDHVDFLYKKIIPLLGGRIAPPSNDPRLWSHMQEGESCTVSCLKSYIRSQVSPEEYQEFMGVACKTTLFRSYREIKSGWGNTTTQKLVTLEVVKELEHLYGLEKNDTPEEFQELKNQITETQTLEVVEDPPVSKNSIENLKIAISILKKNNFNSLSSAQKYLQEAYEEGFSQNEDINEIFKIFEILKNKNKETLSKQQIYILTVLSSLVFNLFLELDRSINIKNTALKDDFDKLCFDLHSKYNSLDLERYGNSPFDWIIKHFQSSYFKPTGIQVPLWISEYHKKKT